MTEHDDQPLRLEQLADVGSPDVMRAALARFRRRVLLRGALIAFVLVGLPLMVRGWSADDRTYDEKLARAHYHEIGTVLEQDGMLVAVLSARRLREQDQLAEQQGEPGLPPPPPPPPFPGVDANRRLSLTLIVPGIRGDEEVVVGPFIGGPDGRRPADSRRSTRAIELSLPFAAGQRTISFKVYAATGVDGGGRGPGTHSADACAEPLNPLGVCEILKSEGRVIGTVTIDLASLDLPDEFWR